MMNHHMPGQPHGQMHSYPHPLQHQRRQQDFNPYHPHHPPQSPIHPYAGYPHPTYYPHQPPQYGPARWQPQYQPPPFMQHPAPPAPPPAQYQPRSPMVVSSTPYSQGMPPITRQSSNPIQAVPQQHNPSPRSLPPHAMQQSHMQHQHHPNQQQQPPLPQQYQQQHSQQQLSSQLAQHSEQQQQQHQLQVQQPGPSTAPTPANAPASKQEQVPEKTVTPQPPATPTQEDVSAQRTSVVFNPLSLPPEYKTPFYPSLPWYSSERGAAEFPRREVARRRRLQNLHNPIDAVALPARIGAGELQLAGPDDPQSEASTIAVPSESETPPTSQAPSEVEFAQRSTSSTSAHAAVADIKGSTASTQFSQDRKDKRSAIAVPKIRGLTRPKASPSTTDRLDTPASPIDLASAATDQQLESKAKGTDPEPLDQTPKTPPSKVVPKSWADLVRRNAPNAPASAGLTIGSVVNGFALPKSASLADALRQYSVDDDRKLSFLEPRGLVNTGNMCYMNSVLQVLIFCVPFYSFLDQVRQRTVHSMKSDTPLVDALILFMREFKVLASAESVDVLRLLLPQQQLEQYGDPVTPEYVYDAIRKLDRFISMRRGHQQDAEEFLGFLLEGLHDECVAVMHRQTEQVPSEDDSASQASVTSPNSGDGWLEVGPKQKSSITRHAGNQDTPSPITKIFGGHLRSELRVQGLKDSVTLEPYKPLQLDIGAQDVNNIVDALKGLTRTESLTGDFGGRTNTAKKQVFIDTLPPVLILHLKRFQYENNLTGTQKIWKKVGYPLELEIPKEVFPPSKRGALAIKGGLPKYRLTSVVYHHGKSAAGGHYTVDVLREDGREWVRMDDTYIRRIRPEDVAEGGAEEDPKVLARALEQHKADTELQKQRNMYQGLDDDEEDAAAAESRPWSEVNGNVAAGFHHHKKWSSIANTNGTATPTSTTGKRTPTANLGRKDGVRDNKVAYILLYERMQD